MGSEQSSQHGDKNKERRARSYPLRREKTMPASADTSNEEVCRSISPELSVCSDSDLPYISYTVNRPIGDSPKLPTRHLGGLQRGKSLGSSVGSSPVRNRRVSSSRKASGSESKTGHNIVVVKPAKDPEKQEKDVHLQRLQTIPMFLPIMRGTLNLPGTRDPEVLEKLDPQDFLALCKRMQGYVGMCAETVSSNQNEITGKVREVDFDLCRLVAAVGEKQKQISKAAEKLSKVGELSRQLSRCHDQLNSVLELMETLNNDLPPEARLEPFVWTTG